MNDNLHELILTCASWQEAQQVIDVLIEKKLVARTEILPTQDRQKTHVILHTKTQLIDKIKFETRQISTTVIVSSASLVQ
jgi:hypothetical protein